VVVVTGTYSLRYYLSLTIILRPCPRARCTACSRQDLDLLTLFDMSLNLALRRLVFHFMVLLTVKPHANLPSYPSVSVRRTYAYESLTESESADEANRSTAVNSADALSVCS
jgi:hypothetical protein